MFRRGEAEKWPYGPCWMFSRINEKDWYFGLFLRVGRCVVGFRYRTYGPTVWNFLKLERPPYSGMRLKRQ